MDAGYHEAMKILAAALLYFLVVFGVGFLVGPVRVLYVEPRVGTIAAVMLEAPILLVAMVMGARYAVRWSGVPWSTSALLSVGVIALALQQIADVAVAVLLRGMSVGDHLRQFATTPGMIYAALLFAFAVMPSLLGRVATRR
jgi:hypothetical protein